MIIRLLSSLFFFCYRLYEFVASIAISFFITNISISCVRNFSYLHEFHSTPKFVVSITSPCNRCTYYTYICTFLETRANCEQATFHDMFVVVVKRGNKRKRKTSFEIPRHMLNGSSSTPFYPPYSFLRLLFPTSSVS